MKRTAILHLVNNFDSANSRSAIHVRMEHLGREHFEWHVATLRSGFEEPQEAFRRLGAQVVDLSSPDVGKGNAAGKVRRYVRENGIRIVHTHSSRTMLVAAAALAGVRGTVHLATKHNWYMPGDRPKGWMYTLLDRLSIYLPTHVIAVSQTMHGQITKLPFLGDRRVTAIQNAIDCSRFCMPDQREACRRELGIAADATVVGYAGRLVRLKKIDLLLRAFSRVVERYPNARLLIVGEDDAVEGRQEAYLKSLADELGIAGAVVWAGFRHDVARVLAAMDIYVQGSSNEGLSKSILEAMAAGKAVVTTDVGGAREIVAHGETGLLIPAGSATAIEGALLELLEDPEKQAVLGEAARSFVFREFGLPRMVAAYRDLYGQLAGVPAADGNRTVPRPTLGPPCSIDVATRDAQ